MFNKISFIGTGYVGLVSGACLSEFGLDVICMDIDRKKIELLNQGIIPIYEPGLENIIDRNVKEKRLRFTSSFDEAVKDSNVIFIAVGTPSQSDGSTDLRYVLEAAKSIAQHMNGYKIIVNKSTVPVGSGQKVKKVIEEVLINRGVNYEFDIVSNPEFLREGSAVNDFMHPDRIVIGTESQKASDIMKEVYRVLYLNNHPFIFCNLETAEIIKYASNAFLALKITFANEIANLCEAVGADIKKVAKAMGQDKRIGKYFLHAGAGYGGSCFPKDTRALVNIGRVNNVSLSLVEATIVANERQKIKMVDKIVSAMKEIEGRKFAMLGLSFKPETDDMREAPSITIIKELLKRGALISAYDPVAMQNARKIFGDNIKYTDNEYDAIRDSDALVIITEWNQFRSLDILRIKSLMKGNYFFDLRNIYERSTIEEAGYIYHGVGR